jgi:hypothetical protein
VFSFTGTVFSLLYICVQPCITISLVIRIINRIMICCYLYILISMLLQRFYSLILHNPGVQIGIVENMDWTGLIFTFFLFLTCTSPAMSGGMAQKNILSQKKYTMSCLFCDFIDEHCLVCTRRRLVASQEYNVLHLNYF